MSVTRVFHERPSSSLRMMKYVPNGYNKRTPVISDLCSQFRSAVLGKKEILDSLKTRIIKSKFPVQQFAVLQTVS